MKKNKPTIIFIIIIFGLILALISLYLHYPLGAYFYNEDHDTKLWRKGNDAIMVGTINEDTLETFEDFLDEYPETKTLIMYRVPGSDDDDSLFEVGRLIRKNNIDTLVPADGEISSGGPELFLAGKRRTSEIGGKVGVHTWWDEDTKEEARNLSREDQRHKPYLSYYQEMGLTKEEAEKLYFFIINAAGPDEFYWLNTEEMNQFKLIN